ncbi:MAG: CRISPR-associated helicase Cas3' [Cellulosilyticaceae bacterium]
MRLAHIRGEEEQSVVEHLRNVARYCRFCAEKIELKSSGELIGWLHDIGKLTDSFETYIRCASKEKKKAKGPDHSTAGAVWITQLVKGETIPERQLTAQIMALTIMSHHGGLVDIFDTQGISPYLKRLEKLQEDREWAETYEGVRKEVKESLDVAHLKKLFEEAVEEIKEILIPLRSYTQTRQEMCYAVGVLVKYLYSCLIDADRYDTATFMDGITMKYTQTSEGFWQELIDRYESKLSRYKSDTFINQLRADISHACYKSAFKSPGIYTLNCPTGAGKTMASLRFALHHAKAYQKQRIFFIVPFITITEQNAAEIRKILSIEEKDEWIEQNILELHSAKEEESEEEQVEEELIAERLAHPIIFTTMVRFLNTFFESGTRNIRGLHQFANAVIVFDEIQTIPPKCIAMFNGVVNFLAKVCNTTIVLSTATQPLLNHVPKGLSPLKIEEMPELSNCNQEIYKHFKRTEIIDKTEVGGNSKASLARFVWQELQEKGNALVVLNTKSSVVTLYEEIKQTYGEMEEKEYSLYVLTTHLYPNHRKKIIEEIREKLRKQEKVLVISTQLIEAGVDISFKTVFRSLAGLDSIIQSAGRCNRHGENGKGEYGQVYLINPEFETLGSLADIKKAKDTVETLLDIFKRSPEQLEGELNSIKAIEAYFKGYYHEQKDNMTYRFNNNLKEEYLMYELLGGNKTIVDEAMSNNQVYRNKPMPLGQSFKTSASYFTAIDSSGKSVVIQHGESKVILSQLLSAAQNEEKYKLLHKLQPYTVNISNGIFKQLEGAVKYYEGLGMYVLNEDYYDDVFGVSTRPTKMTFYNF